MSSHSGQSQSGTLQTSKTYTLSDGRTLGVEEVGAPEGHPIFWFHGWPGSRMGIVSIAEAAMRHHVRILGVDRPGIGLSSPVPNRTFLDWPQDIKQLANTLQIEHFSVVGISGGGPYALACAYALHDRIDSVGLIAGVGPFSLGLEGMREANQKLFRLAARANGLLRFLLWLGVGRNANNRERLQGSISKMLKDLPKPDQDCLSQSHLQPIFVHELQEAFRQGAKWVAKEGAMYPESWGFELGELPQIPTHIWHGELDRNVPIRMSREMAKAAPHIQTHFFEDEGHISILARCVDDILTTLKPKVTLD